MNWVIVHIKWIVPNNKVKNNNLKKIMGPYILKLQLNRHGFTLHIFF